MVSRRGWMRIDESFFEEVGSPSYKVNRMLGVWVSAVGMAVITRPHGLAMLIL